MLQIFYNNAGVWSVGFLTPENFSEDNYFGSEAGIDNLDSEVLTFSPDSYEFFGLEGFETNNKMLASFGAIKMDPKCV